MSSKVFISYRREDSAGHAGRVHDHLAQALGSDLLFMDVDRVPLGANFKQVLIAEVTACDVLLAIIGPSWLNATTNSGKRRLDDPDDFVRIEIASALARGIPVVPILLEETRIPARELLPEALGELSLRNALTVRHASFKTDIDRLIRFLKHQRPSDHVALNVGDETRRQKASIRPGSGRDHWFQDLADGPQMVVIPAVQFTMGSPNDEAEREASEEPRHTVSISRPYAISRHAITRSQFGRFVIETNHKADGARVWRGNQWVHDPSARWDDPGIVQQDDHPAVCISWDDAGAYCEWLSEATGWCYRLPSEAEWEHAARANTLTPFWWGSTINTSLANYDGSLYAGAGSEGEYRETTVPVDRFDANPWGLYQVHGNVWEWCEDVWHDTYVGCPTDGSAWIDGATGKRVMRGGSWEDAPGYLRSAYRYGVSADLRTSLIGFRVVRDL